jgi:MFS family permease
MFYGWYVVLAGAMITGAGIGLYNNCLGVFIKPVCEELSFARGEFTLHTMISNLCAMAVLPFYGEIFRKGRMKTTMLLSAVCCGLVPIGYSFSTRLWQFYALAVINGLMINGITMMAIGVLVNNWFIQKKGIAIGISYSGSGMMAAIMVPVAGSVIENFGWQWGYRMLVPRGSFFWCRRFCLW